MRTYALDEACAEFPDLIKRALAGEPQRIVRDGEEAVVIVSEAEWTRGPKTAATPASAATLADLFTKHAGEEGYGEVLGHGEPMAVQKRPLGSDFLADGE